MTVPTEPDESDSDSSGDAPASGGDAPAADGDAPAADGDAPAADGDAPAAGDGFALRITDAALDASDVVADHVRDGGALQVFPSRATASELAMRLSRAGETPVAVQRAAPQDEGPADAYLVPRPERRTEAPDGSIDGTLTFDTTARQYGALGEALVLSRGTNPPLLAHYAREELELTADERLHVAVKPAPAPITATPATGGDARRWEPDCRAVARSRPDGPPLREYLVEVKTGNGSLLRDQLAVMRAAARRCAVLKVQVDVSALPGSYDATVRRVEPSPAPAPESPSDGPALVLDASPGRRASLDEFR